MRWFENIYGKPECLPLFTGNLSRINVPTPTDLGAFALADYWLHQASIAALPWNGDNTTFHQHPVNISDAFVVAAAMDVTCYQYDRDPNSDCGGAHFEATYSSPRNPQTNLTLTGGIFAPTRTTGNGTSFGEEEQGSAFGRGTFVFRRDWQAHVQKNLAETFFEIPQSCHNATAGYAAGSR